MEQERYLFSRSHIQLRGSIKLWGPKSSLWQPNDFPSSLIYVYAQPVNVMELPVINRISDFPFKWLVPWISGNSTDASVLELQIVREWDEGFSWTSTSSWSIKTCAIGHNQPLRGNRSLKNNFICSYFQPEQMKAFLHIVWGRGKAHELRDKISNSWHDWTIQSLQTQFPCI